MRPPVRPLDSKISQARPALASRQATTRPDVPPPTIATDPGAPGSTGARGVQAAAETYWGQDVQDLDWGQAALLASLIQNPVGYDPVLEPEAAKERRRVALDRIEELGYITEEEADFYDVAPLPEARIDVLPEPNDYFVEEVKQQLLDMPELGETPAERYNADVGVGLGNNVGKELVPRALGFEPDHVESKQHRFQRFTRGIAGVDDGQSEDVGHGVVVVN